MRRSARPAGAVAPRGAPRGPARRFRRRTARSKILYPFATLWNWAHSNLHNLYGTYKVLDFLLLQRLGPGLLRADHPWVTGISPLTGRPIWPDHILFASPRAARWSELEPEPDEVIVTKIGRFLAAMVHRSTVADPEIPQGPRRRMPHAVNYLHGSIHFNGGFLLFNDFRDGMYHLSDPAFVREIRRFARRERRELTLVVRQRRYDPVEYAWFLAFVRARLPWYANANGPGEKRVLAGAPSPYPAVNVINGSWILDMEKLRRGQVAEIVRAPIASRSYFQDEYRGDQCRCSFLERFHVWAHDLFLRLKGFQGGMVFTSRKQIEAKNWEKYLQSGRRWRAEHPVPHPFVRQSRSARSTRDRLPDPEAIPRAPSGAGD